jgi:thymidylate kinase
MSKKNNKKLIWLTGGFGSGKSTMRRMICEFFSKDYKEIRGEDYIITSYDKAVMIGEVSKTSSCDGLDKSFGKIKKEGALKSIQVAMMTHKYVILEGSQTSSKFIQPINEMCDKFDFEFNFIFLEIDDEIRLKRVHERSGREIEKMRDANISKHRQFKNIYKKVSEEKLAHKFKEIDVTKSVDDVFTEIMEFVFFNIK